MYGTYQETEVTRFNDTLASFGDDVKVLFHAGVSIYMGMGDAQYLFIQEKREK